MKQDFFSMLKISCSSFYHYVMYVLVKYSFYLKWHWNIAGTNPCHSASKGNRCCYAGIHSIWVIMDFFLRYIFQKILTKRVDFLYYSCIVPRLLIVLDICHVSPFSPLDKRTVDVGKYAGKYVMND